MIQIRIDAGKQAEQRVHELCQAVEHARVWKIQDRRCTRHLQLRHASGTVRGSVRRVASRDPAILTFDCRAGTQDQAAITAGRFVNLVLRDLGTISDISIHRA